MMKLYSYFRSSASYRVRIALALKNIDYTLVPVHLLNNGGEQHGDAYRALNPQEMVPTLVHDGHVIAQSMAIIEYLEDIAPAPLLVHGDAQMRALIRRLSHMIACDIHPLANLGPQQYLTAQFKADDAQKAAWAAHWAHKGMAAFEQILQQTGCDGRYCVGGQVSMADACLIPQLYNMRRLGLDLSPYRLARAIESHCVPQDAFQRAAPETQSDAPDHLDAIHGPQFKDAS